MPIAGRMEERVRIPDGVKATIAGSVLTVRSGKTELSRDFSHPKITLAVRGEEVVLECPLPRRKDKAILGTFRSHVDNMMEGVSKGFQYRMKIVYSHFPMKASVRDDAFVIENFLGERSPRTAVILGDTKVTVQGDQVLLNGPDVEAVGQTAANIEQATKIRGFDPRVFQDGIYITAKGEESE